VNTPLHHLEPVGLDFLTSAPVRFDYAAPLPAPPAAVFAAISADPSTWTWFPGLTNARYESAAPHGVGTIRSVVMDGVAYRETLLAFDAPTRWAYRVDESSDATFRALAEDWVITGNDDGATLTWTFAVDPQPELLEIIQGARDMIGGVFVGAMASFADHLSAR
jgi:Polyketide cyclase / dehydrase and lipid transport